MNACIRMYRQIEKSDIGTFELILWLANAGELFTFFKHDQQLVNQSREALDVLENTIKVSFLRLLNTITHHFENFTRKCDIENVRTMLEKVFNVMKECQVNTSWINQLFSYLLQWVGGNIIENGLDNLEPYEKYFVNIRTWATTMDDQYLLSLAEKYENLLENKKRKQQSSQKPIALVKLNWKKPQLFLETPCPTGYIRLNAEGSKILSQIIKGRNITLNRNIAPFKLYLPEYAFACRYIEGIPGWLIDFLNEIQEKQLCYFEQLKENNRWDIFLKGSTLMVYEVNIQFSIPPCPDKKQKFGGIYIVWYDLNCPSYKNLDVGDMLFSINDKLLIDITQKDAEKIIKRNNGKVKIEVLKNGFIWILPKVENATPVIQTEASSSSKEENKDRPSKPATPPPKESSEEEKIQQKKTIDFISDIKKKVEDLNNMLEEFDGTSDKDRNYVYMKEIMIRGIIKLDNMETTTNEEVMNMRRDTIYFIQQKTQQLMAKLKENQKAAELKHLEEKNEQHNQNNDDIPQPETSKPVESSGSKGMHPIKQFPEDVPKSDSSKSIHNIGSKTMHPNRQSTEGGAPREISHEGPHTPEGVPFKVSKKKTLVFETRYDLDSFGHTLCSIGIYPHKEFKSNGIVVKLSDTEGRSVILRYTDWKLFLSFGHLFELHFQGFRQPGVEAFGDYFLRFENENSAKFITLLCDCDFVNLNEENVHNLFKLIHLIEMRFNVIANFNFDDYYEYIISKVLKLEGAIIQNIYTLVSYDIEKCNALPCAYAMMEMIQFYPEILIVNVSSKQKM
ncbi:hypothetical protein ILUMI_11454 [Ignelater luminosus]|uniref:PDZ domain-containing protein n=1 Tax=Ignelater luminosus TaxID=2038154 RepID=A0A8K0D086_IGNLU|nr:hypothetical protein ILUMI_11454 [Ignelater luminosus]